MRLDEDLISTADKVSIHASVKDATIAQYAKEVAAKFQSTHL